MNAIHRGLYAYLPGDADQAGAGPRRGRPGDLRGRQDRHRQAQEGVMFSKPVSREVTSKDVKYAIERAFTSNVQNGYAGVYIGDLVGATEGAGQVQGDPGHRDAGRPDDRLQAQKGTGAALAGALAMPISVPVPKEYAQKYDKENPSTYGEGHAVYTGAVHGRVRRRGQGGRLRAGQAHPPRAQPANTRRWTTSGPRSWTRSSSGGQRRHGRGDAAHPVGREHGSGEIEPPASQLKRLLETNKSRALGRPGRRLALDRDGHEPPAVRRHQRPQGHDRGLQPRRGAPAARR